MDQENRTIDRILGEAGFQGGSPRAQRDRAEGLAKALSTAREERDAARATIERLQAELERRDVREADRAAGTPEPPPRCDLCEISAGPGGLSHAEIFGAEYHEFCSLECLMGFRKFCSLEYALRLLGRGE